MLPQDYRTNPSPGNTDIQLAGVQYQRNPNAEYGDHIKNTAAICNTSASHTYGNVLAAIEKYLLDGFRGLGPDVFKTVTASTTLASRQLTHLPHQLHKKDLPIMVLVPRISFGQDENRFLANTLINSRVTNTHALYGDGSLIPLAEDPRKGIYVHGHYNRNVVYIDIVLSFNTYAEQVNALSYINNMFPVNHNQFIQVPLELYIPYEFCELLGNVAKVPVRGEDNSVCQFMTYMNSIWHYPITYKLKGGSNTDEFFMYYIADIDTVIQEPQPGTGMKDGQIKRAFDVSFTVRCDFNSVGYFTLNAPDMKKQVYIPNNKMDSSIVPMFSDVIDLNDFKLPIGWSILCWPIFKLKYGENTVSLLPILNQSLLLTIDYHLKTGIPMERFISIQFRENGEILSKEMFYIDWTRRMLVLTRPDYHRTYRLIVTVSHEYVNKLIKEIYKLE